MRISTDLFKLASTTARIASIASFDLFDTLLTRTVGEPASLFLWLGNYLAAQGRIAGSAEAFACAREDAQSRALANAPSGQATLEEIYAQLAWTMGVSGETASRIMAAELELESRCIRPVPGAAARVAAERKRGAKIAFLSDMYLPSAFLIEQLKAQGFWQEGDECLVSGECRKSKRDGTLFEELLARHQTGAEDVQHCGNDETADVAAPQRKGIATAPFLDANLNRYEKVLETFARDTQGLSSAFAGASRLARLGVEAPTEHLAVVRDVAAGVAAPILTAYVLWILRQAKESGIPRLYFVSRDGQILCDIARRLAGRVGFEGQCRYLHGGRQAWFLAASSSDVRRLEPCALDETDFLSVNSQLTRMGLRAEQFAGELEGIGLAAADWSGNLDVPARRRLTAWLQSEGTRAAISVEARARRVLLRDYLAQEQALTCDEWGLVDVGWFGRLQYFLEILLAEEGVRPPTGYYFALFERSRYASKGAQHCYFFDGNDRLGYLRDLRFITQPLEVFCTATHGVVLGYERRGDGSVRPVLREEENASAISWGVRTVHETIGRFVDCLELDPQLVGRGADLRPAAARLLKTFWHRPEVAEAMAWGRFQFEQDQAGAYQSALAAPYSLKQLRRAYSWGGNLARHADEWQAGSLAMTHPMVRNILRAAGRIGRSAAAGKRAMGRDQKSAA